MQTSAAGSILRCMNELDEQWAKMLGSAIESAASGGNDDVALYLKLKAQNDAIRTAGIQWLIDSMITIATDRQHAAAVTVERVEPHNFAFGHSNNVGSMIQVRQGVRCLTLEAGWTRTPADGFMRGGSLAVARVVHFGMPKQNSDLMLVRSAGDAVDWTEVPSKDGVNLPFDSERLIYHFQVFLGAEYRPLPFRF